MEYILLFLAIAFLGVVLRWALVSAARDLRNEQKEQKPNGNHQEP